MSLRTRIALAVGALTLMLCAGAGVAFDAYLGSATKATLVHALRRRADRVQGALAGHLLALAALGQVVQATPDQALVQVFGTGGLRYTTVAAGPLALLGPSDTERARHGAIWVVRRRASWHSPRLILAEPVGTSPGEVLVVGTSLDQVDDSLRRVREALLVGGAVAVAVASGGAWLLAGAALRPVEALRAQADQLCLGPPEAYLSVPGTRDELAALAVTLNGLLERARSAAEHQRRFVAAASHELRTPLAGMRAELDRAGLQSQSSGELDVAMVRISGRVEHLTRVCEGLLLVALGDHAGLVVHPRHQRLEPVVLAALDSVRPLADQANLALVADTDPDLQAFVDPVRLREVVENLTTNAIGHAPPGTAVSVTLCGEGSAVTLRVRDHGPGFGAEMLARAFEPFARGRTLNQPGRQGAGLGLTVVRLIVLAHGGSVELSDHPDGGALVTVTLPSTAATRSSTGPSSTPTAKG